MLSQRLQHLQESGTILMSSKAQELKTMGKDVIDLSLGEPDFNTPDFIKDAAKKALDENYTRYSPVGGYLPLKEAIVKKLYTDNQLEYEPSEIVVSNGAKHSIYNAIMALINPGDEVLLPAPYWVSYVEIIRLAGGIPIIINAGIEANYKVLAKDMALKINSKTKVIIYSSPNNPTGSIYTHQEIEDIAQIAIKHNLIVISDEIYEYLVYGDTPSPKSIASISGMKERTVVINGLSKSYAMTGWRLGYLAAPKWLAKGIVKFQGQVTSGSCSITQRAAIVALESGKSSVKFMIEAFEKRRNYLVNALATIPGWKSNNPQGAFYVFPDISQILGKTIQGKKINNSQELCLFILEKALVTTVDGNTFGLPESIRISYSTSIEELKNAVGRLQNLFAN